VDSSPVESSLGKNLALKVTTAPTRRPRAGLSGELLVVNVEDSPQERFPGDPNSDHLEASNITSQAGWISQAKSGCQTCHQLGDRATREMSRNSANSILRRMRGTAASSQDKWTEHELGDEHVRPRQGCGHVCRLERADRRWRGTFEGRRAPRDERNVVLTEWEWGGATDWTHFSASTDKRNPTVNANGPVFGTAMGSGSAAL